MSNPQNARAPQAPPQGITVPALPVATIDALSRGLNQWDLALQKLAEAVQGGTFVPSAEQVAAITEAHLQIIGQRIRLYVMTERRVTPAEMFPTR